MFVEYINKVVLLSSFVFILEQVCYITRFLTVNVELE